MGTIIYQLMNSVMNRLTKPMQSFLSSMPTTLSEIHSKFTYNRQRGHNDCIHTNYTIHTMLHTLMIIGIIIIYR